MVRAWPILTLKVACPKFRLGGGVRRSLIRLPTWDRQGNSRRFQSSGAVTLYDSSRLRSASPTWRVP